MQLIGMFDSPFVRRVAVSMMILGVPFEHVNRSVGKDFEWIRRYNPLGRAPTLITDDGEFLIESGAILDFVDELVGPQRALLPAFAEARRHALRLMAIATGAAEKGILQIFEQVFRPAEKRHEPWLARCRTQMHSALAELERASAARASEAWLVGEAMTQADITTVCAFDFTSDVFAYGAALYPSLARLSARCAAREEFASTRTAFHAPKT
jgi:glutathione S-transferase